MSSSRKNKKQKQAARARNRARTTAQHTESPVAGPGPADLAVARKVLAERLGGRRERPAWFGPSIAKVLQHLDAVAAATGPRELEQAVAELTGGEVYRALHVVRTGLWFEWWFEELVRATADRVIRQPAAGHDNWQGPWRLLHGLAAIGSPALRSAAVKAIKDVRHGIPLAGSPDWLRLCPDGAVTGGIWTMRDDYRTRFAVIAECAYPGGADPHLFLFDIDTCAHAAMTSAAVYDSLEQAAEAWRASKGDTALTAHPELAVDYTGLVPLVGCDVSPGGFFGGHEHRGFCDNLFRGNRRVHDIAEEMAKRGYEWPAETGSHGDRETRGEAMAKAFAAWYANRHGSEPHAEAVEWLIPDWLTHPLPGYEHAVSPHRVRELLTYMDDDWLRGKPATAAAYELLPEWVRWNGEEAGIPVHLIERSVAVAERREPGSDGC